MCVAAASASHALQVPSPLQVPLHSDPSEGIYARLVVLAAPCAVIRVWIQDGRAPGVAGAVLESHPATSCRDVAAPLPLLACYIKTPLIRRTVSDHSHLAAERRSRLSGVLRHKPRGWRTS